MADTYLDIVNENDETIGRELRSVVHKNGLLHREIQVWFITPQKEVIFQKRGPDKDINPNMLTCCVGGHVEQGYGYDEAAIQEILEETGVKAVVSDLHLIEKIVTDKTYPTGLRNRALRHVHAYVFHGSVNDLKVEQGESTGFKSYSLDKLFDPTSEMMDEIVPGHITKDKHHIFKVLEKLVS